MRKLLVITLVLLTLTAGAVTGAYAQANNGSVGGLVQDTTKALLPGVTITLTNIDTGVVDTRLTNESGSYNFPSVPPGTYKLTGDLMGFRQAVNPSVPVGTASQIGVNLVLQVGAKGDSVIVTAGDIRNTVHDTSASVGEVLDRERIAALPLVSNNVLDLLTILPGFRESAGGAPFDTVGGLGLDTVNTTINGMTSNSTRNSAEVYGYQVFTPIVMNPDLVGEIKLILAPVDAELGRGNSQVQIQTRSGTNKYSGSGVWNIQNSATNANTWTNNHTPTNFNGKQVSNKTTPNWSNVNQLTGSYGGPIIKNKTFFFFLYDKLMNASRSLVTTQVLTDTARTGIFRYWAGFNPLNTAGTPVFASNGTTGNAGAAAYPSVDSLGNPVRPPFDPGNSSLAYSGPGLICFSIYGNVLADGSAVDPAKACPGGTFIPHAAWDAARPSADPTGFINKVLTLMPHAEDFSTVLNGAPLGDGLNTAAHRYIRGSKKTTTGANNLYAVTGSNYVPGGTGNGAYNNRWQANIKIDHNINQKNRVSVSYNLQLDSAAALIAEWENGFSGNVKRKTNVVTVNGTSTISANMVNEARFGFNYGTQLTTPPWANALSKDAAAAAQQFLIPGGTNPTNGKVYPVLYLPVVPAQGYRSSSNNDGGNTNPLWDYADTIRWTHGKHSFSFGAEYRRPLTTGYNFPLTPSNVPTATGGAITGGPASMTPAMLTLTNFNGSTTGVGAELPGFLATARTNAVNLNYLLSGSVTQGAVIQYWVNDYASLKDGKWQDLTTTTDTTKTNFDYGHSERSQVSNEWSFFAKDDFKITKRLTLNLGLRFDENMSPYFRNGLTNRLDGDGVGLYGVARPLSGDLLSNWFAPGNLYLSGYGTNPGVGASAGDPLRCVVGAQQNAKLPVSTCDPSLLSNTIFIGPGTPNPDLTLRPQKGRISPAIGFAYQLPWFGEGKTSIRGGFQRTYSGAGATGLAPSGGLGGDSFTQTLTATDTYIAGVLATGRALNLTDIPYMVPRAPTRPPGSSSLPIANQRVAVSTAMYAPDYVLPFTDNLTLSLTRNISRKVTMDIRFVDTMGKLQSGSIDLNQFNTFHNPELLRALDVTRAGGDDPFFDQLLIGLNLLSSTTAGNSNYGAVGTTTNVTVNGVTTAVLQRGSAQVRRLQATNLANGNYAAVVTGLFGTALLTAAPAAGVAGGGQALPIDPSTGLTYSGATQRLLRNGCDRIANGATLPGGATGFVVPGVGGAPPTTIEPRCFPENFLLTNPQFTTANLTKNYGHSNYTSGQLQFTVRPGQGISLQGTYSLSKLLSQPANGFTDPLNRKLDYGSSANSIGQEFRTNGTIELPIGPNKFLMGNSSGWIARAIEKWQTSFTYTLPSGVGRTMNGNTMLYANGRPDVVGPWDNPTGHVVWNGNTGQYYAGSPYKTYPDAQCSNSAVLVQTVDANGFNLKGNCTLLGLGQVVAAGTAGSVVRSDGVSVLPLLANPLPGHQGTLGKYTMHTVSRWSLNASASKTFRVTESKSFQLRIDTTNVLNHPHDGDPSGLDNLGSLTDNFGRVTTKGLNNSPRTFQGSLRFSF